jgi:hypothetical protein
VNQPKETDMPDHILLRLRTRWQRDVLDEKLAYGGDPAASSELALRAAQLRATNERERVAAALERAVHEAGERRPAAAQIIPLRAPEIRACAPDLVALARRLRDHAPIDVRGAAMASRLLSDGAGPLYRDGYGDLATSVRAARLALDPTAPAAAPLPAAA